jgi:hypothetical protein
VAENDQAQGPRGRTRRANAARHGSHLALPFVVLGSESGGTPVVSGVLVGCVAVYLYGLLSGLAQ